MSTVTKPVPWTRGPLTVAPARRVDGRLVKTVYSGLGTLLLMVLSSVSSVATASGPTGKPVKFGSSSRQVGRLGGPSTIPKTGHPFPIIPAGSAVHPAQIGSHIANPMTREVSSTVVASAVGRHATAAR